MWMRLDGALFGPFHTRLLIKNGRIRILTERRDDRVTCDGKFRAGNRNRTATATGIWLAELVANKFDARYLSVLDDDARLLDIEHQFRALSLSVLNLF